ncbi:hypothetical protein [Clostridium sp.]|uniref:hypothetical protein n=1 Tax=Clostridium sp. TaxID=1506 RepID=UPI00261432D1|nr:hypothetical protein [Clostridium sp.]
MDKFLIKQRIRELIAIIYTNYSCVGGALHIVLDDDNIEDYNIKWCLDNSISKLTNEEEKKVYEECVELLLQLSYSSRKRLLLNN